MDHSILIIASSNVQSIRIVNVPKFSQQKLSKKDNRPNVWVAYALLNYFLSKW